MAPGLLRNADSQAPAQTHHVRTSRGGPAPCVLTSLWRDSSACFSERIVTVKTSRCLKEEVRETCFRTPGQHVYKPLPAPLWPQWHHTTSCPHTECGTRRRMGVEEPSSHGVLSFIREKNLFWSRPVGLSVSLFRHNLATRPFPDRSQAIVERTARFRVQRGRPGAMRAVFKYITIRSRSRWHDVRVKSWDSDMSEFESQLNSLSAVWHWASCWTSLSTSGLLRTWVIMIVSTPQGDYVE